MKRRTVAFVCWVLLTSCGGQGDPPSAITHAPGEGVTVDHDPAADRRTSMHIPILVRGQTGPFCTSANRFHWDYCARCHCSNPAEGDCDQGQCRAGLRCGYDLGIYHGASDPETDVCLPRHLVDWDYCTPANPCAAGQGDCDSSADCQVGLVCIEDVGARAKTYAHFDLCLPPTCGDGIEQGQETCDDGNTDGGDGCTAACQTERCGNGIRDPNEGCDDGNAVDEDLCSNVCSPTVPFSRFDSAIRAFISAWGIPGGAAALTYQGRLIHVGAYGVVDAARSRRAQRDTRFRIASLSKPITATAILKLVEQGRLQLDQPGVVEQLGWPVVDRRWRDVTLRHLLSHRFGYDRRQGIDLTTHAALIGDALGLTRPATMKEVVQYGLRHTLHASPGTRYAYSNLGYAILGQLIEKVTGQPYEAHVQANVLRSVGVLRMTIGRTRLSEQQPDESYYFPHPGRALVPSIFDPRQQVPLSYGGRYIVEDRGSIGGWIANVSDLSRFLLSIDGFPTYRDQLSSQTTDAMREFPLGYTKSWTNTLGVFVQLVGHDGAPASSSGPVHMYHLGGSDGTLGLMMSTSDGYTYVALFNMRPEDRDGASRAMKSALWRAKNSVNGGGLSGYDLFKVRY